MLMFSPKATTRSQELLKKRSITTSGALQHYSHIDYSIDDILKLVMKYSNNKTSIQEPANLVMLYYPEPDYTGHYNGTRSMAYRNVLRKLDDSIGFLFKLMVSAGLRDKLDVILMSDHGMVDVTPNDVIHFSPAVDQTLFEVVDRSPIVQVYPCEL